MLTLATLCHCFYIATVIHTSVEPSLMSGCGFPLAFSLSSLQKSSNNTLKDRLVTALSHATRGLCWIRPSRSLPRNFLVSTSELRVSSKALHQLKAQCRASCLHNTIPMVFSCYYSTKIHLLLQLLYFCIILQFRSWLLCLGWHNAMPNRSIW